VLLAEISYELRRDVYIVRIGDEEAAIPREAFERARQAREAEALVARGPGGGIAQARPAVAPGTGVGDTDWAKLARANLARATMPRELLGEFIQSMFALGGTGTTSPNPGLPPGVTPDRHTIRGV